MNQSHKESWRAAIISSSISSSQWAEIINWMLLFSSLWQSPNRSSSFRVRRENSMHPIMARYDGELQKRWVPKDSNESWKMPKLLWQENSNATSPIGLHSSRVEILSLLNSIITALLVLTWPHSNSFSPRSPIIENPGIPPLLLWQIHNRCSSGIASSYPIVHALSLSPSSSSTSLSYPQSP